MKWPDAASITGSQLSTGDGKAHSMQASSRHDVGANNARKKCDQSACFESTKQHSEVIPTRLGTLPECCMVRRLLGSHTEAGVCTLTNSVSASTTPATLALTSVSPSSSPSEDSPPLLEPSSLLPSVEASPEPLLFLSSLLKTCCSQE